MVFFIDEKEAVAMKIVLDRRSCNCYEPACESHFGWHFLRDEITPIDCVIEMSDDNKQELTFLILDRDGIDKTLIVDKNNQPEAYDSWLQAWEAQQAKQG
jgi:hypothetical protein